MIDMRRSSTTLRVEELETRDQPSASSMGVIAQENFSQAAIGDLPAGWSQWNSQASFQIMANRGMGGGAGLVASGSSGESARAWLSATSTANVQVSATLRLDSLIPAEIMV